MDEITLSAGMRSNLLSLQEIDTKTRRTLERLATGKKVNSPLDEPTSFFVARALKDAAADLDRLDDAMSEAVNVIKAAGQGLEGISALLRTMEGIVDRAANVSDPAQKKALAASFDELYAQINNLSRDSGYQGANLISNNSTDPLAVVSDDLSIPLNPSESASYAVSGRFMGSGYVMYESPGAEPAWVPDDHGDFLTGYGVTAGGTVGNLSNVSLVIRFNPQSDTWGDVNHNGVLQAGEGTEIDFQLTNTSSAVATGISFSNAKISTGWTFAYNVSSSLGNVAPNSTVITNTSTDLDLNIPAGTDGTQFSISLNVTSDGVTKPFTFGPLTVGSITNGQTLLPAGSAVIPAKPVVETDTVQVNQADYENGVFGVTFLGPPPVHKTLYAEKQGLQIYHSWVYHGFETEAGIDAAREDLRSAMATVREYATEIGSGSDVVTIRKEFNDTLSETYTTGADNLTLADMNEEAAHALMLDTRRELATTTLGMTGDASQAVIKILE